METVPARDPGLRQHAGAPQKPTTPNRSRARLRGTLAAAALLVLPLAAAQHRWQPPTSLSDAEFWNVFTTMSEPGGSFASENFVSNEVSFQEVIPTLQRSLTAGGAYLGVGPEQNFTYIANLRPRLAVIFDIRRQNAMQHLMYKALFELSPTRAEFVARLFSRPAVARLDTSVKVEALFDSATRSAPSDSAFHANHDAILNTLTRKHGFALSPDDVAMIEHVYDIFCTAGPDVSYGTRSTGSWMGRAGYPTYGALQSGTNADSVQMAFLASEENYRTVRELELRNLIVPVVGDFAGPKAIRAVGAYLRELGLTVTAFYVSNVEQYLFRQAGAADAFYGNVASLPIDTTSTFIRSVPRAASPFSVSWFGGGSAGTLAAGGVVVSVIDSGGVRTTRMVRDSAGVQVVQVTVDSTARLGRAAVPTAPGCATSPTAPCTLSIDSSRTSTAARQDSMLASMLRTLMVRRDSIMALPGGRSLVGPSRVMMLGGLLTSGLASMRETLDAFFAGTVHNYDDVIRMTKPGG